jgi:hypothetical protein
MGKLARSRFWAEKKLGSADQFFGQLPFRSIFTPLIFVLVLSLPLHASEVISTPDHAQRSLSPEIQELKAKITELLEEMGRLMEQTEGEYVDPAVIMRLRELNSRYEQLSWELELKYGEMEFGDHEASLATAKPMTAQNAP